MIITFIVDNVASVAQMQALIFRLGPAYMQAWFQSDVRNILATSTRIRFEGEGDDASGAWAPLHEVTVRIRRSMGFPGEHPINVRTGQMKRHILGSPGEVIDFKSGAYAWRWPHGTSSTSGSLRDKLKVAQRGGGSAGTAPPRPVIGLTGNDVLNITSSLAANVIAPGSYIVPGASFS